MIFQIEYAALCHTGFVRGKNQDNFWCANMFLRSENNGLPGMLAGMIDVSTCPAFAIFDGMGGEQQGEMAAYIAASQFHTLLINRTQSDARLFLLDTCTGLNRKICDYQKENGIRQMGTTAAILLFGQEDVFICNIGDSRIYYYNSKKMTQISRDHSETGVIGRKPPLTQSLGIPETEFLIEPYVAKGAYNKGDRYLICSDGLTDMLSDKEILNIITSRKTIPDVAKELMDTALNKGGVDNTTVILCEVQKQSRFSNNKRSGPDGARPT